MFFHLHYRITNMVTLHNGEKLTGSHVETFLLVHCGYVSVGNLCPSKAMNKVLTNTKTELPARKMLTLGSTDLNWPRGNPSCQ